MLRELTVGGLTPPGSSGPISASVFALPLLLSLLGWLQPYHPATKEKRERFLNGSSYSNPWEDPITLLEVVLSLVLTS
jgi:hypothetical protein